MSLMEISKILESYNLEELHHAMLNVGDNPIWRPFYKDQALVQKFNSLLGKIEESKSWGKKRNKEKGDLLEELMRFICSRFSNVYSFSQARTTDNEIDLDIRFNEVLSTPFIKDTNSYFICECKNKSSASVDVGMVSKLVELCQSNGAGLGMFVSHKGVSGSGWKYGEGKRRKLYLSTGIRIISFKIEELKSLINEGVNFYTLIKQKSAALVNETEYDGPSLKGVKRDNPEFSKFLIDTVNEMKKLNVITEDESSQIIGRIKTRYGDDS